MKVLHASFLLAATYHAANLLLRSGMVSCNNNNNNMPNNNNDYCIMPKQSGGIGLSSGVNLNSLVNGINGMMVSNRGESTIFCINTEITFLYTVGATGICMLYSYFYVVRFVTDFCLDTILFSVLLILCQTLISCVTNYIAIRPKADW